MKKYLLGLLALLLLAFPAAAQQFPGKYQATPGTLIDNQGTSPLTDDRSRVVTRGMCDTSATITVAAAAVQEIVALTSGQIIYVCAFVISGDTLATVGQFRYGTGTTCGTGTTQLTGAMRMVDEGNIALASEGVLFQTIASNALCIAATTGAITGFIQYKKY